MKRAANALLDAVLWWMAKSSLGRRVCAWPMYIIFGSARITSQARIMQEQAQLWQNSDKMEAQKPGDYCLHCLVEA